MKRGIILLLIILLGTELNTLFASGANYEYNGSICTEYSGRGLDELDFRVEQILHDTFNPRSKDDYEELLRVNEKISSMLGSITYSDDLLCHVYLGVDRFLSLNTYKFYSDTSIPTITESFDASTKKTQLYLKRDNNTFIAIEHYVDVFKPVDGDKTTYQAGDKKVIISRSYSENTGEVVTISLYQGNKLLQSHEEMDSYGLSLYEPVYINDRNDIFISLAYGRLFMLHFATNEIIEIAF